MFTNNWVMQPLQDMVFFQMSSQRSFWVLRKRSRNHLKWTNRTEKSTQENPELGWWRWWPRRTGYLSIWSSKWLKPQKIKIKFSAVLDSEWDPTGWLLLHCSSIPLIQLGLWAHVPSGKITVFLSDIFTSIVKCSIILVFEIHGATPSAHLSHFAHSCKE